ncbi:MAG TPA: DNA polymerase, partial [Candidatus Paceibacterota bacterium]|nr:DNA polymerase [Candidatus Paceibacterota bacterium]
VKVNEQPVDTYCGSDPGKFLRSLDWRDKAVLAHNAAFDGAILSWVFGIKPKFWLDTLSMAKPLHRTDVGGSLKALAKHYNLGVKGTEVQDALGKRREDFTPEELERYMQYCANDVDLTYQLFKKLKPQIPSTELVTIDQTMRMYTEPSIELDTGLLQQHLDTVRQEKHDLMERLSKGGDATAIKKVLMSNEKFAKLLRKMDVEPPTKISPRTGKEAYAFAKTYKAMTDLLEHPDKRVGAAVAARMGVKSTLDETRTEALIGVAKRGRLPIMLKYYGAHTGRFSGGDGLNLQNLPGRSSKAIRQALTAPPEHVLIASDSSQIEARMVAWLAGQRDLVDAFADGRDVYSEFITDFYGRTITKSDKKERFVGKTAILSLQYGVGAEKFRNMLRLGGVVVDEAEAKQIVDLYRNKYNMIPKLWRNCDGALPRIMAGQSGSIANVMQYNAEGLVLPNGLPIKYLGLKSDHSGYAYLSDARIYRKYQRGEKIDDTHWKKLYGAKMVENISQALSSLVIKEQMAAAYKN